MRACVRDISCYVLLQYFVLQLATSHPFCSLSVTNPIMSASTSAVLTYVHARRVVRPPIDFTPAIGCAHYTEFDFVTTEPMPTWQPLVKDAFGDYEIAESEGGDGVSLPKSAEQKVIWLDVGTKVQPTWGVVWLQPGNAPEPVGLVGVFGRAALDGIFHYSGDGLAPVQMYTTHIPGAGSEAGTC
jgi:hypothetical protein